MCRITRLFSIGILMSGAALTSQKTASAQYPVVITSATTVPAVVGYVPEQRGLFGLRTVYRPVVAKVTPAVTVASPVAVSAPVTVGYSPAVTTYYAPSSPTAAVTTYYAPSSSPATRVTTYYAPVPSRITTYYAPSPPVVPVTTYRVPASVWVPVAGF